jgi:hypothetical protein
MLEERFKACVMQANAQGAGGYMVGLRPLPTSRACDPAPSRGPHTRACGTRGRVFVPAEAWLNRC